MNGNKRENCWERCLVGRERGREFWWGPGVFSSGPPKHYLSKLERKLCKTFWKKCPFKPTVCVRACLCFLFVFNSTRAWALFLIAMLLFFFFFGMVVLLFCLLIGHDWFFLVEFFFFWGAWSFFNKLGVIVFFFSFFFIVCFFN